MVTEDELRILAELRNDGRKKVTEIARKLKIPLTTVYDKKRRLEKNLITGYVAITKSNLIKAWLIAAKDREKELHENRCINNLYLTNKGFMAEAVCKDIEELENLKEKLNAKEHIVISEIKKEDFWTRSEHLELAKTEKPSAPLKKN